MCDSKKCFKCEEVKPLCEFYKHPQMSDGRLNKCKSCSRSDSSKNRSKNIDYYLEYDRARSNNHDRILARARYSQTEAGKEALRNGKKKWTNKNIIKRAAHCMVNNAIRDGKLTKQNVCSKCGSGGRIHGHHDDYAKPLDVRWLCSTCHCAWHKENGEAING